MSPDLLLNIIHATALASEALAAESAKQIAPIPEISQSLCTIRELQEAQGHIDSANGVIGFYNNQLALKASLSEAPPTTIATNVDSGELDSTIAALKSGERNAADLAGVLIRSIIDKKEEIAAEAVYLGANPAIADSSGKNAIHYVAIHRLGYYLNSALKTAYTNIGVAALQRDNEGNLPLDIAIKSGLPGLIDDVVKHCFGLMEKSETAMPLLIKAIETKGQNVYQAVRKHIKDEIRHAYRETETGNNILHIMLNHQAGILIDMSDSKPELVTAKNNAGKTPLDIALDNSNWQPAKKLIEGLSYAPQDQATHLAYIQEVRLRTGLPPFLTQVLDAKISRLSPPTAIPSPAPAPAFPKVPKVE